MSAAQLPADLCLSLRVSVNQQFAGQVPGGYRIDLYYSGERSEPAAKAEQPLTCAPGAFSPVLRAAIDAGKILSGNDWVTINSRGVLDFDSRITLELAAGEVRCPVAGRLRGRVHLGDTLKADGSRRFERTPNPDEVFAVWEEGFEDDATLPLALSAAFDIPTLGFGKDQTALYAAARDLGASLFIGAGAATFRNARYGAVRSIALDLYRPRPDLLLAQRGAVK